MRTDKEPLLRKRHSRENSSERREEMEARAEHQTKQKFKAVYGVSAGLGVILAVLLLVWLTYFRGGFAWRSDPAKEFNWHPLLMVFGFVCLYSQSLLIFRTGRDLPKKKLKLIHTGLHFTAFICSVIGLIATFDSHNLKIPPIPNLYTLHSWIGLITVILFATQFVAGFTAFLYPGFPGWMRSALLPIHTSSGIGIFIFAIVSSITGLVEKAIWALADNYKERPAEAWLVNFIGVILLIFGTFVLYLVNAPEYKRVGIPEDQMQLQDHGE